MSRIRSVHPGLWTDEGFVSLSAMARLLLVGLWNECDDFGAFDWKPLTLKMRILPADMVDVAELLAEIERSGAIRQYAVDGRKLGAVRNFCRFQRPKKPTRQFPMTPEIEAFVACEKRNIPAVNEGEFGTDKPSKAENSPPVPHQFPTSGEIAPQMEDGGDKGRKKESPNQPTSPSRARPREALPAMDAAAPLDAPPGAALDGWEDEQIEEALTRVAEAAGLPLSSPAKRKLARATLVGWLRGWDGCDLEGDLLGPIRSFLFTHDGPTHSLARFDAVIADRKARARPKRSASPAPGKCLDRSGEGAPETAIRAALRHELGDAAADAWIEPARLSLNCTSLTVACPSAFHAEHVRNQFGPVVRQVARRIAGPAIAEIAICAG